MNRPNNVARLLLFAGSISFFSARDGVAADRLAGIAARGFLVCGVELGVPGFSVETQERQFEGFDVDVCRAIGAAILGANPRVSIRSAATINDFRHNSSIDLVTRRLTATEKRERTYGVRFGPILFHDGQGFLVTAVNSIVTSAQLAGRKVCIRTGGPSMANLLRNFHQSRLAVYISEYPDARNAINAVRDGECAAWSDDISELAATRALLQQEGQASSNFRILSQRISQEPLAPMVRSADTRLLRVLRLTSYVLLKSEELGIDSRAARALEEAHDLSLISTLRIPRDAMVQALDSYWAHHILETVGNYAEIFDRNLGALSSLKLPRSQNALCSRGGQLCIPPL